MAAAGRTRSKVSARAAYREVTEFLHATFSDTEQEDNREMTLLVSQA